MVGDIIGHIIIIMLIGITTDGTIQGICGTILGMGRDGIIVRTIIPLTIMVLTILAIMAILMVTILVIVLV